MELTLVIGDRNFSSWSLRSWLTLKMAGATFREVLIPLRKPYTKAAIAEYSPSGKVPVLIHDRVHVWDSLAICEYIAEMFPAAYLWPKEWRTRAVARSVAAEMHADFSDLRRHMPMDIAHRYNLCAKTLPEGVRADIQRIMTVWATCRQQYGHDGPFLFGPFTIADAMYAPVVTRFVTYAIALDDELQAYTQALLALPFLQSWIIAAEIATRAR